MERIPTEMDLFLKSKIFLFNQKQSLRSDQNPLIKTVILSLWSTAALISCVMVVFVKHHNPTITQTN